MLFAFGAHGEIHHHDAVLLDDADQHDDADDRDHAEVVAEQHQHQQGADRRRWKCRKNGQRVNEAFVEHAEDQVDDQQCGGDQIRRRCQRSLEGLRRALERAGQRRRNTEFDLGLLHRGHRIAERHAGRQIEAHRHRWELALMVDDEISRLRHVDAHEVRQTAPAVPWWAR